MSQSSSTPRHGLKRPPIGMRRISRNVSPRPSEKPSTPVPADINRPRDDGAESLLYTAEQAAALLQVRPSWLRRKATARAVPCRFIGKHLRFSRADLEAITNAAAQPPRRYQRTQ
jgi:hypothetical protein